MICSRIIVKEATSVEENLYKTLTILGFFRRLSVWMMMEVARRDIRFG